MPTLHKILKWVIAVIFAAAFLGAIIFPPLNGTTSALSFGPNGMVETRCIEGFEYKVTTVSATQVLDANGRPVGCSK